VALIGIGNLIGSRRFRSLVREIEVVGHADQSQYRPELGLSNWSISTARAATVAEFLVKNTELSPCIVIPSGRADYFPRDGSARSRTDSSDAADRRIELLLHPVVQGDTTQGRRPGCRSR
jgi:flagellar motor protein MotB